MPLYMCGVPADVLDDQQRQRIAAAITRIHCDVTGAPPTFVHVVFTVDVPASWVMEGGALLPEPGEEAEWLAAHAGEDRGAR